MNADYEELYKQRCKRINRATHLKEPDRVPVLENFGYFAARYAGITSHEFLFDYDKASDATVKTSFDFGYDTGGAMNTLGALPLALALLDEHDGLMPSWVNEPSTTSGRKNTRGSQAENSQKMPRSNSSARST